MRRACFALSVALTAACGPGGAADRWDPIAPFVDRPSGHADGGDSGDVVGAAADGAVAETDPGTSPVDPTWSIDAGGTGPDADATAADAAAIADSGSARDVPRDPAANDARTGADRENDAAPVDATVARGCPGQGCKRIFVTSIGLADGGFGSLAGADAVCQSLADKAALGGGWWAWISDATGSPASRFVHSDLPYLLLDGSRVAANWDALTSGDLLRPIDVSETGRAVPVGRVFEVWTGTTPGGHASDNDCDTWSADPSPGQTGSIGLTNRDDRGWTQAYAQFCDREDLHLYCVEQ